MFLLELGRFTPAKLPSLGSVPKLPTARAGWGLWYLPRYLSWKLSSFQQSSMDMKHICFYTSSTSHLALQCYRLQLIPQAGSCSRTDLLQDASGQGFSAAQISPNFCPQLFWRLWSCWQLQVLPEMSENIISQMLKVMITMWCFLRHTRKKSFEFTQSCFLS